MTLALRLWVVGGLFAMAACGGRAAEQPPDAVRVAEVALAPAAPTPVEETVQGRLKRRRDAILAAPPCAAPPSVETSDWEPVVIEGQVTPLRLPRQFQIDTTADFRHGGVQWRAGGRTFFLQNGWWAVNSPNACRASLRAGDYIVEQYEQPGRLVLAAFPADTVWRPSLLMGGAATNQAELDVLWTILRSVPPYPWR